MTLHADAIEIRRRAGDLKGLHHALIFLLRSSARRAENAQSAARAFEEAAGLESLL